MNFAEEIEILTPLVLFLKKTRDLGEKLEILLAHSRVEKALSEGIYREFFTHFQDLSSKIAFLSILAIKQEKSLFFLSSTLPSKETVRHLIRTLVAIDHFYESIGGLVGYQLTALTHLSKRNLPSPGKEKKGEYLRAPGIDLSESSAGVDAVVAAGIRALPEMGEIYPIGGLGSRLNLVSKNGEPLPAAFLPFLGRTLLEGLVRDIQAREFLYFRLFGKQITVPIALMTSLEKRNHTRVRNLCFKNKWFGRPKESFHLFSQLSVPVIDFKGNWVMQAPFKPLLQPGGHGALWRTAEERGVFYWFQQQEKHRFLIRQINNPIGGIDKGLLGLIGVGKKENKAFGFASCERLPQAAEGILVLREKNGYIHISNIEYTDFKEHGVEDLPMENGYSHFPANTNILYADIKKLHPIIKKNPLPGLLVNMKNKLPSLLPDGKNEEVLGGRLESMMQNISDALQVKKGESLPVFLTYNARERTISAAKRSFTPEKALMETPEGAFYDLLFNAHTLLKETCGMALDPFCGRDAFLDNGPSHVFLYHPALGPLYSLIGQKIRKGRLFHESEIQLEIADVLLQNLDIEGSCLIEAENILGHYSQGITRYSHKTGKCILRSVSIQNKGIDRTATNCYWKNQIKRQEAFQLILKGHSEFIAENVSFLGDWKITVPDGERWVATQNSSGEIVFKKGKAGLEWNYHMEGDRVVSVQNLS